MPREEDLPPSKGGKLADKTTEETMNFFDFFKSDVVFSKLSSEKKINWLITYVNKNNAIYNLIIEDLKERIEKLENGVS